jgi:radical SAM superfamily enzyme YgiQ (UPF0313 family)
LTKERIKPLNILLLALNAKYIHSSLALRSIKAYCEEYINSIELLETTINNNENEIIKEIYKVSPDVLGISCYIWNMSFIKILIPTLKKILPQMTIILGGPEVSYQSQELLTILDVDFIMEGEGEETWQEYLDYRFKNHKSLSEIDGLVYKQGTVINKNRARTPLNLEYLPFVYDNLTGLEHKIIYYEASRGCPFNCQYCLSSIQSGVRFVPVDRVKEHLHYFCDNRVKQVKFVDRTFNANKKYALALWHYIIAHDNGYTNFHFEIAAELIDEEMITLLKGARKGLIQFEIGVQSTNPKVLATIKRKMPYEEISKIVLQIKALANIHQHLDLIAGLPFEDYTSFKNSFNDVIALRPEQFQLGFLKVLKGSGLRKNAAAYGLVYKQEPPYEILYTDALSYNEILRLHSIEEMLERYYNSERFKTSLEYLFTCFESPFSFFEALALYWEQKGYDLIQHNKMSYTLKLCEFCLTCSQINPELIKEFLRFDYLKHEHLKEIPTELQTLDSSSYKEADNSLLKNDDFINIRAPHLIALSTRQRHKITHIEHFKYHLYKAYTTGIYEEVAVLKEPCSILFDYASQNTKCILLS